MSSKYRKHNKRKHRRRAHNKHHSHHHQRRTEHKKFEIGAFICIRKQREGVGIVHKIGDKNSYLIAFKNGKYGWYRSTKINAVTEQEYLDASDQFVIDKNLPSPSPTPSYSYSVTPSPAPQYIDNEPIADNSSTTHEEIKFTQAAVDTNEDYKTITDETSANKAFEIKIEKVNNNTKHASGDSHTVHNADEVNNCVEDTKLDETITDDIALKDHAQLVQNENVNNTEEDEQKGSESNTTTDDKALAIKDDEALVQNESINAEDDEKKKGAESNTKSNVSKCAKMDSKKVLKQAPISKFEKKLKSYYKVKDLRERSFLIMCDECKTIDCKALYEYIEHFGKTKPSEKKVKGFLNYMKPNVNGLVTFSKFVSAIDDDGDIVAAYKRFKKCGNARSKKSTK